MCRSEPVARQPPKNAEKKTRCLTNGSIQWNARSKDLKLILIRVKLSIEKMHIISNHLTKVSSQ
jgi:hypothetical protein